MSDLILEFAMQELLYCLQLRFYNFACANCVFQKGTYFLLLALNDIFTFDDVGTVTPLSETSVLIDSMK